MKGKYLDKFLTVRPIRLMKNFRSTTVFPVWSVHNRDSSRLHLLQKVSAKKNLEPHQADEPPLLPMAKTKDVNIATLASKTFRQGYALGDTIRSPYMI